MFQHYNHLGFMNPYYTTDNNEILITKNPALLLENSEKLYHIDCVSLIEMLSRGFCFGDRTIITEIKKTPWMAKPASDKKSWEYYSLPNHSNILLNDYNQISKEFYNRLENELICFVKGKKNIGIFLTGGMDSRITGGILNNLIKKGYFKPNVLAITWGLQNSRDVIYAKEIAKRFNWEWLHINLTPEHLYKNIEITADNLCEFAPLHLHAMYDVSLIKGLDCILASSFGDSIGRGVFSSRHLLKLTPFSLYIRNWHGLIEMGTYNAFKNECIRDLDDYKIRYPREFKWQTLEIERLAIYMRRLLNPCMAIINNRIPVFQTFSSPNVYSYIWSIDARYRTDKIYEYLIKNYFNELIDIPWSQTGTQFNTQGSNINSDNYSKEFHNYSTWIRNDLFDVIYNQCLSRNIQSMGLLNMEALKKLININKTIKSKKLTSIDIFSIWLASLSHLISKHNNIRFKPVSNKFKNVILSQADFCISQKLLEIKKSRLLSNKNIIMSYLFVYLQ